MAKGRARPRGRSARPASDAALYAAVEGLQRLADVFDVRRRQLVRDAGLTDAQWRVLEEIGRDDFMPSLFARRRACTAAAVSRTLRQLQELGLITATISSSDGRQRDYRLTAAGRRTLGRLAAGRHHALDAVWRELPRDEVERFGRFSQRLADQLEAYADRVDDGRE